MSKSVERVKAAAAAAGVTIEIRRMPASTRTADEAAAACGCDVSQIVKSLIFQQAETEALALLLVSGAHAVDLGMAATAVGAPLSRADPKVVRAVTGFAIGGVAPIGSLQPIDAWMDETLLAHPFVWAAAGAPDAVFSIAPEPLRALAGAQVAALSG